MRFISELQVDEYVVEHYLCKRKETFKSKNGKNYLSLLLQDKTGTIDAKVWELNNSIQSFNENDFIKIEGSITTFKEALQLNIKRIRKSNEGEYFPNDYIPTTEKNIDELYIQLSDFIASIKNVYIKQLLSNIYIDNLTLKEVFKYHSAAKTMHHNYLGGLLEHTVSIAQMCDFMASHYTFADRDILIAVALLHDIGKVYELSPFPDNDYTDDGKLLGHIVIGTEIITAESSKIDGFPHELQSLLKHCLLSHHGIYEYGSPKRPKTIEAFILHAIDNLDAQLKIYQDAIFADKSHGNWVGYHKVLGLDLRKSNF